VINSSLEFGDILLPLLEQQISPPYRIVARHLDYLQKWRKYLFRVWTNNSDNNTDMINIQQSVDDLISTVLFVDFVGQSYPPAIPTLEEILKIVNKPTAFSLCEAIRNQLSCELLKAVFNPDRLIDSMVEPRKDVELSSLTNISKTTNALYGSRIPITLLGDFHQLCIHRPVADKIIRQNGLNRRSKGIYYTPAPLVDYLVSRTFKNAFKQSAPGQIEHLRILDPSCGCGAFLIASLRFILKWLKDKHDSNKKSPHLSPQQGLDLLGSTIYGTDIDRQAIHWTRKLLLLTVWDFYMNESVNKNDICNLSIPVLEDNIVCTDFLKEQSLKNEIFHVIIGGPPFVRVQGLYKSDPQEVNKYKHNFRTAKTGQFDLYMLFVEKAIKLLADMGYLSMSVSNTFLRSESGRALRKLIAEKCTVSEIVEFEDRNIYPNAKVQIAAITLQKTAKKDATKHVLVKAKGGLRRTLSGIDKQHNDTLLQIHNLPATACASESWVLNSESETSLLYKIESTGTPLGKLPIRICFGGATGADKVFMLKDTEYLDSKNVLGGSRLLSDIFVFEHSILRPILRGHNIKGYASPEPETLCIFPYDETGNLITEDMLQTRFPLTYKYLRRCKSYLISRKQKGNQPWYAFRNEDVPSVTQCPKIVGSVVNSGGGFAMDWRQHLFCNNSVLLICQKERIVNYYFLLAVLNSKVFRTWTQHRMPTLGLGWYCYRVSVLRRFPIPIQRNKQNNLLFDKVANLASMLLNVTHNETERANILSLIDSKICKLYGISQSELPQ
jgi:hypothetical protein